MSDDLPKIEVEHLNRVDTWGSEPKEDNGWISIKDKLPKAGEHVFLLVDPGADLDRLVIMTGEYSEQNQGCWRIGHFLVGWDHDYSYEVIVTAWAEIPPMLQEQAK